MEEASFPSIGKGEEPCKQCQAVPRVPLESAGAPGVAAEVRRAGEVHSSFFQNHVTLFDFRRIKRQKSKKCPAGGEKKRWS